MIEQSNERNRIDPGLDGNDDEIIETDTFTYTGSEKPPRKTKNLIIQSNVREIPDEEFKDMTELVSIVFSDDATDMKIGKNAFMNCNKIASVRLNGTIFIGDEAFLNCSGLAHVELGSDIQHIGMGAFKNCSALASITVPPNVTFIGDYAFANCPELKTATIMDGVVEISAYCFQNDTSLEQVILPTSIEKVGEKAFENCPNVEVYVPTMDRDEAEELLGVKMVAKAEDDDTILKCNQDYIVRLYKDLY